MPHLLRSDRMLAVVDYGERGVTGNSQVLACIIRYKIWSFVKKEHIGGGVTLVGR